MSTTTAQTSNFITLCRTSATAQAAADKAVADAQAASAKLIQDATAQGAALVKTATDNQTKVKTTLASCPPPLTSADLRVAGGNGQFTMDTSTATLSRPAGSSGMLFIQSVKPLKTTKDAFVTFQMSGPKAAGTSLFIGLVENPQANIAMANGKMTGMYLSLTYLDPKYYACAHNGQDGEPSFIQFQNPFNPTLGPPSAGTSPKYRQVKDDTSTFTLHFDGSKFNFYHNSKLVHSEAPRTLPSPTATYSLLIRSDIGGGIPFKLTNFMYGNAPSASDIQAFTRSLPQTGGRRKTRGRTRRASRVKKMKKRY